LTRGKDLKIFRGEPNPYSLKQGDLGNCYFIASLSTLAEFPERIKRLFYDD